MSTAFRLHKKEPNVLHSNVMIFHINVVDGIVISKLLVELDRGIKI